VYAMEQVNAVLNVIEHARIQCSRVFQIRDETQL
jgi:hypothetical protein